MSTEETTFERVSKAILDRARVEAEEILEKARKEAEEIINKAKLRRKREQEEEEAKIVNDAKRRARATIVKAILKVRRERSEIKKKIIDNIVGKVREHLEKRDFNVSESLRKLLREALETLPQTELVIYVNRADIDTIKKIIKEMKIEDRVKDIRETNIIGGVIVETVDGKFRIDNSYETRLGMVLCKEFVEKNKGEISIESTEGKGTKVVVILPAG